MDTIGSYMGADHARCDALLEQLEARASAGKWVQAETDFRRFEQLIERHFGMEENILFPAFEQATLNSTGPTSVMRMEHGHIRGIISRMASAVQQRDTDDLFGHADTLRIMVQQHNLKEESILYLMADRVLADRRQELIDAMDVLVAMAEINAIDAA